LDILGKTNPLLGIPSPILPSPLNLFAFFPFLFNSRKLGKLAFNAFVTTLF